MQKQAPGLGRILVMVAFSLSVFGLLTFLWVSFGGAIPLKPEGYRFQVVFPEAPTLVQEADVRISGIDVGKVKDQELSTDPIGTLTTIELDDEFAPIPETTRAILRQKTLLGETYVELTPATDEAPMLDEGEELEPGRVAETTELEEIFQTFDADTRRDFRRWVKGQAEAIDERGFEFNNALANFPGFAESGADVLRVLDRRGEALERFVRNTGIVFEAISREEGQLRELIINSNRLFDATASRDEALARIFEIFPTFLDESRATLRRLREFSVDTRPLVNELRPVARDLGPTLRSLGDTAPDLEDLFRDLDTLIEIAPGTLPDAERFLDGAEPVLEAAHVFLPELNPILSFANFQSPQLADFLTVGGAALAATLPPREGEGHPRHVLRQIGLINDMSLALNRERPPEERANAYLEPNALLRARPLGIIESFDCSNTGEGEKAEPTEGSPPCFVKPPTLWGDGGRYPTVLQRGEAPVEPPPQGNEGAEPAVPVEER